MVLREWAPSAEANAPTPAASDHDNRSRLEGVFALSCCFLYVILFLFIQAVCKMCRYVCKFFPKNTFTIQAGQRDWALSDHTSQRGAGGASHCHPIQQSAAQALPCTPARTGLCPCWKDK